MTEKTKYGVDLLCGMVEAMMSDTDALHWGLSDNGSLCYKKQIIVEPKYLTDDRNQISHFLVCGITDTDGIEINTDVITPLQYHFLYNTIEEMNNNQTCFHIAKQIKDCLDN